jgi:prolyl 4-hydroxylase
MGARPAVVTAEEERALAICAAVGAGVPQDWTAALDLVRRAAESGSTLAQAELTALAGDWQRAHAILAGAPAPQSDWARIRSAINLPAWLAAPRRQILSASPRIAMVEDFAPPESCDWLIARAWPRLAPAKVYDHATGGSRSESARTNSECHFRTDESDLVLLFLRARMAAVTELPMDAMEATAILHYLPGQEFMPHVDFFNTDIPAYAKDVAEHGQRVLTFLLCLNDQYEGGETEFVVLGKRWKGRKGYALFFWNVGPDGVPDARTRHAGLPPTSGEKWLLSQWIRGPAV